MENTQRPSFDCEIRAKYRWFMTDSHYCRLEHAAHPRRGGMRVAYAINLITAPVGVQVAGTVETLHRTIFG